MLLPHRESAVVADEKLSAYLLSESHPIGRSKAAFFRSHGFDDSNVGVLREQLISLARKAAVVGTEASPFGVKYILEGELATPVGRTIGLRIVWIIESGSEAPRLVTAYPA